MQLTIHFHCMNLLESYIRDQDLAKRAQSNNSKYSEIEYFEEYSCIHGGKNSYSKAQNQK